MRPILATLLVLIGGASCLAEVADLTVGTVQLPGGYTQNRTGTKDSEQGEIKREDGKLVVHYDIGFLSGTLMHDGRKPDCTWYREQVIGGHKAIVGLVKHDDGRQLIVTLMGAATDEPFAYPANFWAQVESDEDIADTLLIALSYEKKP